MALSQTASTHEHMIDDADRRPAVVQRILSRARGVLTPLTSSYAHLLLSRSPGVGALLMLGTALVPRMFVAGLASVLFMQLATRLLGLSREASRSSLFGCNALLVGLGIAAQLEVSSFSVGLGIMALTLCILLTSSLHTRLELRSALPVLTWPFLATLYVALGALPWLPVTYFSHADAFAFGEVLPPILHSYLRTLGALLFLPRADVGLCVLAALWTASRISTLLSVLGFGLLHLIGSQLLLWADPQVSTTLSLNAVLIAISLGGTWFVPSKSSFALAAFGSLLTLVLGLSLWSRLANFGLPLLILPFNATLLLILFFVRTRVSDGFPKAVDFLPGSPEQNLAYYRTSIVRFGSVQGVRFSLPFRGLWTCTQGVSGKHTHQGAFRHALDFEVTDSDGKTFQGEGKELTDYYCYRLPVVSSAPGIVAKVVDGIADNKIGENDLIHSWGNAVILYHAPGLYSCVCHLSPGTISVREGQWVPGGEVLGLAGSSGRSPVPHLHFQLQSTYLLGAHTQPMELHDLVRDEEHTPVVHARSVPEEAQAARNLEPDPDKAKLLRFVQERPLFLSIIGPTSRSVEVLIPRLDFTGRTTLVAESKGSTLYYGHAPALFNVYDVTGESVALHMIRWALSRVPFDATEEIACVDRLPLRPFLPWWARSVFDLVSPFLGRAALSVRYRVRRRGRALIIEGESLKKATSGRPILTTAAVLMDPTGLLSVEINLRGRRTRVEISTRNPKRDELQEGEGEAP